MKEKIEYHVDYRSCPSGLGLIIGQGKNILITSLDAGPEDMEEAKEMFSPLGMPDQVIHIPIELAAEPVKGFKEQERILRAEGVEVVRDVEAAYNINDNVDGDGALTLDEWVSYVEKELK